MVLQTRVDIEPSPWKIEPQTRLLFVGSCFADNIGRRFQEDMFRAQTNPLGVMYNPASVLHTIESIAQKPDVTVITLGTNHVYREKSTGEIVDNCQKRPADLFQEEELSVAECAECLRRAVAKVGRTILTVSPIRYRKYGFHGSQLSKATLLLAARQVCDETGASYFPAYELMNDELRDYRFYQPDMLHPSAQAVEYIFGRFAEAYFSDRAKAFVEEWRPLKEALGHRPRDPESEEYAAFRQQTREKVKTFKQKYELFD